MEKYKTENGVQNVPITIFLNLENEDQNVTDFNDLEGEFITWKEHERAYNQDPEYILKSEHERLLSELKKHLIDTGEMFTKQSMKDCETALQISIESRKELSHRILELEKNIQKSPFNIGSQNSGGNIIYINNEDQNKPGEHNTKS